MYLEYGAHHIGRFSGSYVLSDLEPRPNGAFAAGAAAAGVGCISAGLQILGTAD